MSLLGDAWGGVKKGVVGAGHAVGNVASNPWVQGITAAGLAATGVGAPAAAAIMAAQRGGGALLKPGGNIGQGIRGGIEGAAMGAGASKLGSVVRGAGSIADKAGSAYQLAKQGLTGGAGSVMSGLTGGGGPSIGGVNPAIAALAAAQGVNAAQLGAKANEFSGKAWDLANDSYTNRAPLRAKGIGGLLNPSAPTANLGAIRAQNPVAGRISGRVG